MNKKFNSEYRGLSKSEKIYDYEDGKLFREIEIYFDDDGYDYSIAIKKDRHYDYYEGRYID